MATSQVLVKPVAGWLTRGAGALAPVVEGRRASDGSDLRRFYARRVTCLTLVRHLCILRLKGRL